MLKLKPPSIAPEAIRFKAHGQSGKNQFQKASKQRCRRPLRLEYEIFYQMRIPFLLSLLLVCSLIQAQTTLIPDVVFEQLLIEAGLDNYPIDGEIATASIDTVTSLNLYTSGSTNVTNLSGIGDFAALTFLMVNFSDLTALDLSQNLALEELHAYDNDITSLVLPASPNLSYLELTGNPIGTLDITQNPGLTYLSCSYGELDSLDVTHNPELQTLSCMINNLTVLDLSQNTHLISCSCDGNSLSALDLSNNLLLSTLSCGTNSIEELDISNHDSLTFTLCSYNNLTVLDISNNTALEYLDCSHNQITSLDASNHLGMIELFCQYNALTSLGVSANMIGIDCDNNQLDSLDISGVVNLVYSFDCSNNPMTCIHVSETQLADIPLGWVADPEDSYSLDCNVSSIKDFAPSLDFSVYPNPTNGPFSIAWDGDVSAQLVIFNASGQVCRSIALQQASSVHEMSLASGVYTLMIRSGQGRVATERLIIR